MDAADAAEGLGEKGYPLAGEGQLAVAWSAPASLPSSGFSVAPSGSMGGAAAARLPPGLEVSLPVRAAPGPPRPPRMGCPPPPPPSLTSSMAARGQPRAARTAAVAASPGLAGSPAVGAALTPSPPNGGLLTPRAAAAAAARQRSQGGGADPLAPLLAQMPTYGWQRSIVDYAAIHFVLHPDGSYVELGSGASATVGGRVGPGRRLPSLSELPDVASPLHHWLEFQDVLQTNCCPTLPFFSPSLPHPHPPSPSILPCPAQT